MHHHRHLRALIPIALTWLMTAATAAEPQPGDGPTPDGGAVAARVDADDDFEVHLWPLLQRARLVDGKRRTLVLCFWHRTTNPDGSTYSSNILNWVRSPEFTAALPLFYRIGPPERRHTLVIPLWFQGPRYATAPLLLTARWTRDEGGHALWVTPLFHLHTTAAGRLEDLHLLAYWQDQHRSVLFPVAYRVGEPGRRHLGVVPLWFSGPRGWIAPPLLSGGWRDDRGVTTTWVTPLFHVARDRDGVRHLHLGNWFHGRSYDVVFPLWFQGRSWWCSPPLLSARARLADGGTTTWATPLVHVRTGADGRVASWHALNVFHGRGIDTVFPLAWRVGPPGDRRGCVLPLFAQTRRWQIVAPLFYRERRPGGGFGILPAWLQGRGWWCSPVALSGGTRGADGGATWITPLFHHATSSAARSSSTHLLNWFAWSRGGGVDAAGRPLPRSDWRLALPLYYRHAATADGRTRVHTGLIPLAFRSPEATVVPPLLSARWRDADGSTTTWITPLAHRGTFADGGTSSLHLGPWFEGAQRDAPDADGRANGLRWRMVFPLFYRQTRVAHGNEATTTALLPLCVRGPGYTVIPPLLAIRRRTADGGTSTWVTPLFHLDRDRSGAISSMHALTYLAGRHSAWLLPIGWRTGSTGRRHVGIVPLWFQGPGYRCAPPALSWWRRHRDGSTSTWITPLAHVDRDACGRLTGAHLGTYLQGRDWRLLFPLAYRGGRGATKHVGVIPLWFSGPGYWTVPLALSGGAHRADRSRTDWVTPLFHRHRAADGSVSLHALTYLHGPHHDVLFPLAWSAGEDGRRHRGVLPLWVGGPGYGVCPLALSGWRGRAGGGGSLWITPLFHRGTDGARTTDWHALNLIHAGGTDVLLPLAWRTGAPGSRSWAVAPLYFHGPSHLVVAPLFYRFERDHERYSGLVPLYFASRRTWVAPLLLSGGTRDGGRRTTVVTPLFHRTTDHGRLVHQHLLNLVTTRDATALVPLFWRWRTGGGEQRTLVVPLGYQRTRADGDRTTTVGPALASYHRGPALDTSLPYQLIPFSAQRAGDGSELNLLWRLLHVRAWRGATEVMVGPLWWSRHEVAKPAKWQVLGGLLARDRNDRAGTSRLRLLWLIPFGPRTRFAPAAPAAG